MKNLKCPYCDKKVNYFGAIFERNHGEYTCLKCLNHSTILYKKRFKLSIFATIALSVLIFVLWLTSDNHFDLTPIFYVIILYFIFIVTAPLFMNFVKIKEYNYSGNKEDLSQINQDDVTMTKTKIISNVNEADINKILKEIEEQDGDDVIDISKFS